MTGPAREAPLRGMPLTGRRRFANGKACQPQVYVYLSKLLPWMILPPGLVVELLCGVLLALWLKKTRLAAVFAGLALAVLWGASMPVVAGRLYAGLEGDYPAVPLSQVPAGGCVVLLGGVISAPAAPRVDADFNEAIDRVYKTAQLYRAGKAPLVIVTAGNQPWSHSETHEAELIRDLLVEWGVAPDDVMLEGSSRNTRENAVYSRHLIDAVNCRQPLLVTSAAHMRRAVGAFRAVGVPVTPVPTDFRVADTQDPTAMDFLPSAGALAMTSEALREWLGRWVYRVQGWG